MTISIEVGYEFGVDVDNGIGVDVSCVSMIDKRLVMDNVSVIG